MRGARWAERGGGGGGGGGGGLPLERHEVLHTLSKSHGISVSGHIIVTNIYV